MEDEDIQYTYNSSGNWVTVPSSTNHNALSGLQGGTSGEYYHLTSTQYASLTTNFNESVMDVVGPMFNHSNHTGLTATYDDANDRIDLSISYGGEPGTVSSSSSGSAGTATTVSRSDHSHDLGQHAHSDSASGGTIAHSALTGQTADDHHNQVHTITGSDHTASGLTVGHVLRATGASSFAFQAIAVGDLPAHASTHQHGGSDEVGTSTPTANAIVKADASGNIVLGWFPILDCGTLP